MTSRETMQIVEVDCDFCSHKYGEGACTAALSLDAPSKCYNTFKTCQDPENYDKGILTLRYGRNQSGLPMGQTIFPALKSVSTSPTRVNVAGVDADIGSLGRRERVTIQMQDFLYSDALTDKYHAERLNGAAQFDGIGFDPASRGTHFGKQRARNPFYYGRGLRVLSGFVGDDLASMTTRHYINESLEGPSADGSLKIVARDILALAENEKAVCPAVSSGKLKDDVDAVASQLTLTPEAIGATYPTSGFVVVGSEVMGFSRVDDVMTVERGKFGTDAASHDSLDAVQVCYRADNILLSEAISELLVDYAGIDQAYVDLSAWNTETERWLPGLRMDCLITKPTGVLTLLAELALHGASIWWEGTSQSIRYRLNRIPDVDDPPALITDDANMLEGSVTVRDKPDDRLSNVIIYYDQIDPTGSATSPDNYRKAVAAVDLESEGENQYDQSQYKTLYSRWSSRGSESAIISIALRMLNRFRDTPTDCEFQIDIKDAGITSIADILTIRTRMLQGVDGLPVDTQMQVKEFEETIPGHRARVVAQTFFFQGRFGFATEDDRGSYDQASGEEKRVGTYAVGPSLVFDDGQKAYEAF